NLPCLVFTENLGRKAQNAAAFLRMVSYRHTNPKCVFGQPVRLNSGFRASSNQKIVSFRLEDKSPNTL
ncbi:MAG: hypothetical protein RIC19_24080, partial [Phaeodactylibacter sp.]|uniref:hypothetical protein n=1 Tax=Phaeodactylibacter sp. TaxID=1940289 RepID=UPI0032EF4DDF